LKCFFRPDERQGFGVSSPPLIRISASYFPPQHPQQEVSFSVASATFLVYSSFQLRKDVR
jgi:hypothetical protein